MAKIRGARPLRSVLYFAGDEPEDVENSARFGSDAIMIDLEEPRTPFPEADRGRARRHVGQYLRDLPPPTPTSPLYFVRVQSIGTGRTWQDLSAVFCERLTGVLLPKISSRRDVIALDALLTALEVEHGLPAGSKLIYPILETAAAIAGAYKIAKASERVKYMGGALSRSGDLQQALGYRWTPESRETLFLRSKVLLDARRAGIRYPISGMWAGRLDDLDGLRSFATELRNLGYYGMLLNSMSTGLVPIVHEVFTPTPAEVAYWQELVHLEEEAARQGTKTLFGERSQGEGHVLHGSQIKAARLNLEWARALAEHDGTPLPGKAAPPERP